VIMRGFHSGAKGFFGRGVNSFSIRPFSSQKPQSPTLKALNVARRVAARCSLIFGRTTMATSAKYRQRCACNMALRQSVSFISKARTVFPHDDADLNEMATKSVMPNSVVGISRAHVMPICARLDSEVKTFLTYARAKASVNRSSAVAHLEPPCKFLRGCRNLVLAMVNIVVRMSLQRRNCTGTWYHIPRPKSSRDASHHHRTVFPQRNGLPCKEHQCCDE